MPGRKLVNSMVSDSVQFITMNANLFRMENLRMIAASLMAFCMTAVVEAAPPKEASQEVRNTAAIEKLNKEANTVCVYAKGLCCPSCAIGIRKKVGKLSFVDTKRLAKGVDLDVKTQLVTIAVKAGADADPTALAKAIDDAGYDAVHLYTLSAGKLGTRELAGGK